MTPASKHQPQESSDDHTDFQVRRSAASLLEAMADLPALNQVMEKKVAMSFYTVANGYSIHGLQEENDLLKKGIAWLEEKISSWE